MTDAPKKKPAAPKKKAAAKRKPSVKSGTAKKPAKAKAPQKKAAASKAHPSPAPLTFAQRLRKWALRGFYIGCGSALLFVLVTLAWVVTYRFVEPPFTGLMLMRHLSEGLPIDKVWRDYEDISPDFLVAVLAGEDQRFYEHHGFDLEEIKNAIEERSETGHMRGASTLSQQTAKNVFLWPARSWCRKGVEVYFTLLIEALWPKRRILEVYVNVAEMGPGVYGVESAAHRYFDTSASGLSREEAALLAAILPSPLTRDPKAPTEAMRTRQEWILKQMNNLGGASFLQ